MAERTYPEHDGTALDQKVFTHPVTAEPMPILVKDVSATSGGGATEAKQDEMIALLDAQADKTETQPVSLASVPLPAGAATAAKQDALLAELEAKSHGTIAEPVVTTLATQVQTPTFSRSTTSGSVAVGAIHVSVTNVGSAAGIVLGTALKAKETVHFTATDRQAWLQAIPFDATGTEFVITTLRV